MQKLYEIYTGKTGDLLLKKNITSVEDDNHGYQIKLIDTFCHLCGVLSHSKYALFVKNLKVLFVLK